MTIHVLQPQQADTTGTSTAYDSVWAGEEGPGAIAEPPSDQRNALEQTMLSNDKLYVVLAVVLLVWLGIVWLLFRTDRRLARLERQVDTK